MSSIEYIIKNTCHNRHFGNRQIVNLRSPRSASRNALTRHSAHSLGVYRFWRGLGYAIGAISAGIIADIFGLVWAIGAIAALTFLSGAIVALVMRELLPGVLGSTQSGAS